MATLLAALSSPVLAQGEKPAPKLALKDIEGRVLRLSDYKGKVVLLNFWATWCAPCRAEMPDLTKWQREYKSQGLQIIGITYPPVEVAEAREFLKSIEVSYPVVLGEKQTKAIFDKGDTLPVTVVIDKKGMIREVIQGIIFPEEFEEKVKPLLRDGLRDNRGARGRPERILYRAPNSHRSLIFASHTGRLVVLSPPSLQFPRVHVSSRGPTPTYAVTDTFKPTPYQRATCLCDSPQFCLQFISSTICYCLEQR
jgi:thiol-disulfide isomerase/thioredoxin